MVRTTYHAAARTIFRTLFLLSCGFLACCATLPDAYFLIQRIPHRAPAPDILGPRGELSLEKRNSIIRRLEKQAGSADLLKREISLMESISDFPLVEGNNVTLLINDRATYAAMFSAMQEAKDHINFETYIFDDDENGRHFADLFLQKQAQGVQVNLIYDSEGSSQTPAIFFQRLKNGGVNVLEFNPIDSEGISRAIHRDHRKILIVDGKIAFTGGVNIGRIFSVRLHGKYGRGKGELTWRDTDIRVEGPVVTQFQKLFLDTWRCQKGPKLLHKKRYFPYLKKAGDDIVRVVGSTPGKINRVTYIMYIAAITFAQNSIHLTNAYFVPDKEMVNALTHAAQRGVDVKLILPGASDIAFVFQAGRSYYTHLLKAGVKLYERRDSVLHAKTGVIDGVWSTVGSTNLDLWSFLRNNEVNAVILGRDFAEQMEAMFKADLADSNQIQLEKWEKRPFSEQFKEWFARLFAYWL
jgi:cardiolipin synthase A/B